MNTLTINKIKDLQCKKACRPAPTAYHKSFFPRPRSGVWVSRLAFLALLLSAGCYKAGPAATADRVDYVYDGDSFVVLRPDGSKTDVRLAGIDAPERDQPYADRSRRALTELIDGREVTLSSAGNDRYDRLVATAYLAGETESVNAKMVRRGHAWAYPKFDTDGSLAILQDEARKNGRGLWDTRRPPLAPWKWRYRQARD